MRERLRQAVPAMIGLALFVAALEVLRHELSATSWTAIKAGVSGTPRSQVLTAVGLTALNYLVLTVYDFLAFASIGRRIAAWRIGAASFLAYAIANNVGFAMVSGASVRYRFYTRWGVGAEDLSRIIFSYSITFWLGLLALGGLSLALGPLPQADALPGAVLAAPLGWLLFSSSIAYVVFTVVRSEPLRLWRFEMPMPPPAVAIAQWVTSSVDWILAGMMLYVLMPAGVPFFAVLGAFLAAQIVGLVSHVPGGAGVFEGLIVLLLKPYLSSADLVAPLLLYRAIYYLLPLGIALVGLLFDEVWQRRAHARRTAELIGRIAEQLTPRILSALTFFAGVLLLFSGATPAAAGTARVAQPLRAARRRRDLAFRRQPRRRGAADPLARRLAPARRGLPPGDRRHRRRHRRIAAEGRGRGRSDRADAASWSCSGSRGRRSIAAPRSSRRGSRAPWIAAVVAVLVDLGVARFLRLQARGVLERAVVAIRAVGRSAALSARVDWRRHRGAASWPS